MDTIRVDGMDGKTDEEKAKAKKDSKKDTTTKMHRRQLPSMRSLKRGI